MKYLFFLFIFVSNLFAAFNVASMIRLQNEHSSCKFILGHLSESSYSKETTEEDIKANKEFFTSKGWVHNPEKGYFTNDKYPFCIVWFDVENLMPKSSGASTASLFNEPQNLKIWKESWKKKKQVDKIHKNFSALYESQDIVNVMVFRYQKDLTQLQEHYEHELTHIEDYKLEEAQFRMAVSHAEASLNPLYLPRCIAFDTFTEIRAYYRNGDKEATEHFNKINALRENALTSNEGKRKLVGACSNAIELLRHLTRSHYIDKKTGRLALINKEMLKQGAEHLADLVIKYGLDSRWPD